MIRSYAALSGAALAAVPLPLAVGSWAHGASVLEMPSWRTAIAAVCSLAFLFAGLSILRAERLGRRLLIAGCAGVIALLHEMLLRSPALSLGVSLASMAVLFSLSPGAAEPQIRPAGRALLRAVRARAASAVTGIWLLAGFMFSTREQELELWAMLGSLLISATASARWLDQNGVDHLWRATLLLGSWIVTLIGVVSMWGDWWSCLAMAAIVPAAAVVLLPAGPPEPLRRVEWWEPIAGHPERLLGATFFAMCAVGTIFLALPASSSQGTSIGVVDAAFTAVSAVCVTGLTVLDTGTAFSATGQFLLLLLIQLGGLGIMTFSTAAMGILGGRFSLRQEGALAELVSPQDRAQLYRATQRLLIFTLAAEAAGALLLFVSFFAAGDDVPRALWRAIFTAVSAFCNAGFALQADSLVPYASSPFVLHVVGALIIAGGTSPLVVLSLPRLLRKSKPVSAHVKLAVITTVVLLLGGFAAILGVEWNHALRELSPLDRLHNAWFMSVSTRTAGFNAIDMTALQPASVSLIMLWMFIGANPGGTGGGIKTTTAGVLLLAVAATARGSVEVDAFGKRISTRTVYRAAAIITVSAAAVFVSLFAMLSTQDLTTQSAFFEVVSALGTVGLSLGATVRLDGVGKAIIILCMFIGRIGTLSLFMFLTHRSLRNIWERPEEEIAVG